MSAECMEVYTEMNHYRSHLKYAVFKLTADESEIVVEARGDRSSTYEQFVSHFPENDIRWACAWLSLSLSLSLSRAWLSESLTESHDA